MFFLCSHCDRGYRYCIATCSLWARREQRRRTNQRCQRSPEGRLDHRDRQRQYRTRRHAKRCSVTDHSSFSPPSRGIIGLAALAGGFGLLAGLLAAVGLSGILSYSVTTRRNEIGIRMALGADRGRVVRLVLGQSICLRGAGVAAVLAMTLTAGRLAGSLLYGLEPRDPLTLFATVLILAAVDLASNYAPARQAAR